MESPTQKLHPLTGVVIGFLPYDRTNPYNKFTYLYPIVVTCGAVGVWRAHLLLSPPGWPAGIRVETTSTVTRGGQEGDCKPHSLMQRSTGDPPGTF